MTRQAIIQHLQIIAQLKLSTKRRVQELQELEAKAQNDLIAARQIDAFLDLYAEACNAELSRAD